MSPNAAVRGFRKSPSAFLLLLLLAAIAVEAHAQQSVVLGNAVAALTGPWKFHTGDNMTWAQPDFDDSAWNTMDLTPTPGPSSSILGSSGYVPGWTARGYKGTSGYAWYRLRVNIQDGQARLAIKLPDDVDDAYQVYVNGQMIGEFGRFTDRGVTAYITQPRAFLLPENFRGGPVTLAIRMWMGAFTPLVDRMPGDCMGRLCWATLPPSAGCSSSIWMS